jgi:hypothetical protein
MNPPDLRSQPEIAKEIGLLMMYASNLEIIFVSILAELMGDREIPSIIALQVDSISAKMKVMFDIAESCDRSDFRDAVLIGKASVLSAINYRNALAHGHYVFDENTHELELLSNMFNRRRGSPKSIPLKAEAIAKHREALRLAIGRMVAAANGRLWNPLEVP